MLLALLNLKEQKMWWHTYINCTVIQNCRLTVVNKEKESMEGRRFNVVGVNVFTRKGIKKKEMYETERAKTQQM